MVGPTKVTSLDCVYRVPDRVLYGYCLNCGEARYTASRCLMPNQLMSRYYRCGSGGGHSRDYRH